MNAKDQRDPMGWTPLLLAATKEVVELLIANGADVNAKGKEGETLLHFPKTKEIAELLIAAGADVNARDEYGDTPLDMVGPFEDDSPEDQVNRMEIADLLRKHGGKTAEELKAAGN